MQNLIHATTTSGWLSPHAQLLLTQQSTESPHTHHLQISVKVFRTNSFSSGLRTVVGLWKSFVADDQPVSRNARDLYDRVVRLEKIQIKMCVYTYIYTYIWIYVDLIYNIFYILYLLVLLRRVFFILVETVS